MKIRKAQAVDDFASAFAQEENLPEAPVIAPVAEVKQKVPETKKPVRSNLASDVVVTVNEYAQILVDDDSEIKKFEIKGEVKLTINNPLDNRVALNMNCDGEMKFKTPSKVDSGRWSENRQISLSSEKATWAVGGSKATTVLRWRQSLDDPDELPMLFTVWGDEEDDGAVLSIEF